MSSPTLNPDDLDEVVEAIRALTVGDRNVSADLDPAQVQAPGVWVQFREVEAATLSASVLRLTLYLVVGDTEVRPTLVDLAALLAVVGPLVDTWGGPAGPTRHVALGLPDGTVPALALPVEVDTVPTPAP